MISGLLGKKVGMTQMFDDKGDVRPITVLQAGPCVITQKKDGSKDGYDAVQLGFVEFVKGKNVPKPMQGHFAKNNLPPVKFMKEFQVISAEGQATAEADNTVKVGDKVLVDIFQDDKFVDISGVSKGRGFAGTVKRHKFGGGPASHGHMFQVQGSIGASSFPSRVFPGQRMSGHMGAERVTVRNLRILGIDKDENLLVVEGAVPGPRDGYVVVTKAKKPPRERRGFTGDAAMVNPLKASKRAAKGK
jgi:large subunit ribosomal protein L3